MINDASAFEDEPELLDSSAVRAERWSMTLSIDVIRTDDVPLEFVGQGAPADRSLHGEWSCRGGRCQRPIARSRRLEHVLRPGARTERAETGQVRERRIEPWSLEDNIPDCVHAVRNEIPKLQRDLRAACDALDRYRAFDRRELGERNLTARWSHDGIALPGFEQWSRRRARRLSAGILDEEWNVNDVTGTRGDRRRGGSRDGCGCDRRLIAGGGEHRRERDEPSKRFHDPLPDVPRLLVPRGGVNLWRRRGSRRWKERWN